MGYLGGIACGPRADAGSRAGPPPLISVKRRIIHGALAVELLAVAGFAIGYRSLDLYIYWLGGHAVTHDARLYTDQLAGHWFTNTPFMAVLFRPVAPVPFVVIRLGWQLASAAAFVWACTTTCALAGRRGTAPLVLAGSVLEPVWHTIFLGQVNLFLLALVLYDMRRVSLGRSAGVGIGLAAAVKLTPAVFIVLLLAAGRVRAAATATATFALCTALGWLVAPDASRLYWLHTFYDTGRVGVRYISNQSPYGLAVRSFGGAWSPAVPVAIGVAGLTVAAAWARRQDWLGATAATGTTGLLVSPISWTHHWVWFLPALVLLLRDGHRVAALGGYLLFVAAPPWWTPRSLPGSNAYLLAGVALLLHLAVRLGRGRPALPFDGGQVERPGEREAGEEAGDEVEPWAGDTATAAVHDRHQR